MIFSLGKGLIKDYWLTSNIPENIDYLDPHRSKIGDGATSLSDIPWIMKREKSEQKLSEKAKSIIENHIDLIENNDYDALYSIINAYPGAIKLAVEVTKALFKAGLNPKEHLSYTPRGCETIFYYEGKADPNDTIKTRGWANIKNPHPNRGKTWTMLDQKTDYLMDYINGYDTTAEETNTLKELESLKSMWRL